MKLCSDKHCSCGRCCAASRRRRGACGLLPVRGEGGLAAEFDALDLGVGSASRDVSRRKDVLAGALAHRDECRARLEKVAAAKAEADEVAIRA